MTCTVLKRLRLPGVLAIAGWIAMTVGFAPPLHAADRASTTRTLTLTLYSVAIAEQFRNDADDRQRGMGSNPFGRFSDTKAQDVSEGGGPYPGDQTVFEFDVYRDKLLHELAGSATIVCVYNFDKNAFCNATYRIKGGSIFSDGGFNFNADSFTLAISGGVGTFSGARGDLAVTPSVEHAQRLAFTLSGG
jgi:hypothetical protein